MQINLHDSAAAIALAAGVGPAAAGVGSAAAGENFGTLDDISAFDSLAGIQAIPLGTDEMASITVAHWVKIKTGSCGPGTVLNNTNGIWDYTENHQPRTHGVK